MKEIIKKIYNKKIVKKHLSKTLFILKNRPSVESKIGYNIKRKAIFTISADFELGWAFRYSKSNPNPKKMANQSRQNFPFLLKMFEDYKIPITWATVGHLFLKQCKKGDHDWMHRIPYFENRNWLFEAYGQNNVPELERLFNGLAERLKIEVKVDLRDVKNHFQDLGVPDCY